jgi:hypothetical protein
MAEIRDLFGRETAWSIWLEACRVLNSAAVLHVQWVPPPGWPARRAGYSRCWTTRTRDDHPRFQ